MAFQFRPYSSPLTESIAERIARRGDIEAQRLVTGGNAAAQAALTGGQAWGNAIRGIGQTIGAIPGQIQDVKAAEQQRAARAQQMEAGALQLGEAQRQQAGRQAVAGILQGDQLPTGDVGPRQPSYLDEKGLYDVPKLTARLNELGFGDRAADLVKGAETINESITKHQATQAQLAKDQTILSGDMAHGALMLMNSGMPVDQAMDVASSAAVTSGSFAPGQYAKVKQQILSLPPDQQQTALEGIRNQAEKLAPSETLGPEATRVGRYGTVLAKGAEKAKTPTEASLAADLSSPDPVVRARAETALKVLKPPKPEEHSTAYKEWQDYQSTGGALDFNAYMTMDANRRRAVTHINTGAATDEDVKEVVQGMIDGTMPPELPGRASPTRTKIMAEAQRRGFNLAGAATDWMATQKHIATLNGAQQLRLNQAVNALPEMLDKVDDLATQWKGGKFPVLNKANLALAKGGAYGTKAATIANQLDAQIADVVADLGNVYMGGNSPTDHALSLAQKSLNAEWSEPVLRQMVTLAKQNVQIRRNSINNTGVAGASTENPYMPAPTRAVEPPPVAPPAGGAGRIRVIGPNGETGSVPAGSTLPPGWKKQ